MREVLPGVSVAGSQLFRDHATRRFVPKTMCTGSGTSTQELITVEPFRNHACEMLDGLRLVEWIFDAGFIPTFPSIPPLQRGKRSSVLIQHMGAGVLS